MLVSGAAGATGSVVGEIAKLKGCRTELKPAVGVCHSHSSLYLCVGRHLGHLGSCLYRPWLEGHPPHKWQAITDVSLLEHFRSISVNIVREVRSP